MAPRLLIITAAFGEGHNSAARNLGLALDAQGATTRVADPCMIGAPVSTEMLSRFYRAVTTYSPRLWAKIYRSTDRQDFSKRRMPLMRKPERCLGRMVEEFEADAVICTYPLYPYFLARIFSESGRKIPVFTAVTDSIEINSAWLKAPTDYWLVTDPSTRTSMIRWGLPAERVIDTGFPVNPTFSTLAPVECEDCQGDFRVLFFPTAQLNFRRISRALLNASPDVKLTVVMGRSVRLLWKRAKEIRDAYPGRVKLIGWTRRVPQLLNTHHLIVGKAGGATVHEAIAARCPMLIHHLVPGQEEGNLRLLESIGAGSLAPTPEQIGAAAVDLLSDNRARWRQMKQALARHGRNAGALHGARFILDTLANTKTKIQS
jgi:processive 1,2-diacylglycerol beta-glucosyltransferase